MSTPTLRKAERQAYCRGCDKIISKGEDMVSFHSFRNQGMSIHLCLECSSTIGWLAKTAEMENVRSD